MSRGLSTTASVVIATLAIAAAGFVGVGLAEEGPAQEDYVAAVEPICKRNTEANKHILAGVRRMIRAGKRKAAGRRFFRAARAFHKATSKIARVPRPPAYAARLGNWIKRLRIVESNLRRIGKGLKTRNQRVVVIGEVKLRSSGNAANNIVYDFDFHNCRITPSRFS